ncbi:hypothetical protein [Pseudoduganella lutea]|uniref:Uncharacterized protein n=1 Tax=Pseudoduganella lutea TaxID=321985 RepID=A0A4P6KVJ7_9BURK|nr:hypothetical protein [Pseudoduganella lutea]QBE63159.1 hypothetical protein EWM63_09435 [Pseudoduganella lutea]
MATSFPRFYVSLLAGAMLAIPAQAFDTAPDAKHEQLCLRGPTAAAVSFRGAVNYDKAGGKAGMMMYPAPGLAGLVAAIATHAAVSASVRESEKQKLREESDAVVAPYLGVLGQYKHEELMRASLVAMKSGGQKRVIPLEDATVAGELLVDTVPTFYLTQDQRAIIVENAVRIERGTGGTYEKVIRVISPAQDEKAGAGLWLGNEAALLKAESARIYAQSLDIAIDDLHAPTERTEPFKTVRYDEGGTEKMERAQVIGQQCSHLVLRTLRGDLLAVPRKLSGDGCRS